MLFFSVRLVAPLLSSSSFCGLALWLLPLLLQILKYSMYVLLLFLPHPCESSCVTAVATGDFLL